MVREQLGDRSEPLACELEALDRARYAPPARAAVPTRLVAALRRSRRRRRGARIIRREHSMTCRLLLAIVMPRAAAAACGARRRGLRSVAPQARGAQAHGKAYGRRGDVLAAAPPIAAEHALDADWVRGARWRRRDSCPTWRS